MLVLLLLAAAGAQDPARSSDASRTDSAAHAPHARADGAALDSLVARARAVNPALTAARARVSAAAHRATAAGAAPDPMLMAGVQNVPIASPAMADPMTMRMLGVSQVIPLPGKLASRARAAEHEARAAQLMAEDLGRRVDADVRRAYYEVAWIDAALRVVRQTHEVLASLAAATEARYAAVAAGQQDVIRARLELTRLADDASALEEQRRAALARLNALLDQPAETPLPHAAVPARLAAAAVAEPGRVRFASAALGSRAIDSPLPPLDSVQRVALDANPMLRARAAMADAQAARVALARLERRPDVTLSLQYGQRSGFDDMISAGVSLPIPLRRGRSQDAVLAADRAELEAMQMDLAAERAELRATIASRYAELERARTQLALIVRALLPQGRAAMESAIAAYQAGRAEFVTVLEAHTTLFNIETSHARALSDFASALAELERHAGQEVLP